MKLLKSIRTNYDIELGTPAPGTICLCRRSHHLTPKPFHRRQHRPDLPRRGDLVNPHQPSSHLLVNNFRPTCKLNNHFYGPLGRLEHGKKCGWRWQRGSKRLLKTPKRHSSGHHAAIANTGVGYAQERLIRCSPSNSRHRNK